MIEPNKNFMFVYSILAIIFFSCSFKSNKQNAPVLKRVTYQSFATNEERDYFLYLTGLSYGGFGTWYMASKYPEMFAAIAPIVGYGHPDLMAPIAENNIPIWCFSGGRDMVVQQKHFYPGLNKLEKLGHTNLRFTTHEDMGHDTWRRVYGDQDLYDWFLQNEKRH